MNSDLHIKDQAIVEAGGLQELLEALKAHGYRLVGPRVRDGAIVYDKLASADALPAGWTDEQDITRRTRSASRRQSDWRARSISFQRGSSFTESKAKTLTPAWASRPK